MPRQPTGRPRGRPKGSGELGESLRLTVRIPLALYERLTAFAEGCSYTRGAPQMAVCVREALEEYLANKGQTKNTPLPQEENNRQTKNVPSGDRHISGQTEKQNYGQTKKDSKPQAANLRQIEKSTPVYDTGKYVLGKLCRRQQFPLIALQSILLMSMGQFGHPGWLGARQTVIKIGDISVSKPIHFMLWADPAHDDWQSPS